MTLTYIAATDKRTSHVKDSNLQAVVNNTVCTPVNPGQDFDLSIVALNLVRPIEREATGGGHVAGTAGPPRSIILPVPVIIVILLFLLSSYSVVLKSAIISVRSARQGIL